MYKYDDLKDCPKCNNSLGKPLVEQHKEGRWFVSCANINCGCSTGFSDTEEEAIVDWNDRFYDANKFKYEKCPVFEDPDATLLWHRNEIDRLIEINTFIMKRMSDSE